jgi:hypothetical protein
MDTTLCITARPVLHGTDGLPALLTEESPLCINIGVEASGPLPANADLILTAHEVFTSRTRVLPDAVPNLADALDGEIRLRIPGNRFVLPPGCWHILLDVMQGEKSLAGTHAGSTEVYVRAGGESSLYSRSCHNLARAEFAFDRRQGVYLPAYQALLPDSIDPFSDEDAPAFCSRFATAERLTPEMIHHGGLGFLLAAHAFHALGNEERAQYCEESVSRAAHVLCERMKDENGRLHALLGAEHPREPGEHRRATDALALKFLCQAYFYFRNGPREEKDYARYLLDEAKDLFRCQLDQPLEVGGGGDCRADDGRLLAGAAWYLLAHKSEHGQYFSPDARQAVVDFAAEAARELLAGDGWYDRGCSEEDDKHLWRANLDLVSGLLPVWRVVRELSERGDDQACAAREQIREGVEHGLLALTHPGTTLPDVPPVLPSALPDELRGAAWEVCEQYRTSFGEEPSVQRFAGQLGARTDGAITGSFADLAGWGAALHLTSEYQTLEQKPPLPWWE